MEFKFLTSWVRKKYKSLPVPALLLTSRNEVDRIYFLTEKPTRGEKTNNLDDKCDKAKGTAQMLAVLPGPLPQGSDGCCWAGTGLEDMLPFTHFLYLLISQRAQLWMSLPHTGNTLLLVLPLCTHGKNKAENKCDTLAVRSHYIHSSAV